jgi:magnesium-transporting ATPase (P-type)
MQTEFGKIALLTQTATEAVSPLRREIQHLSRWIGILAVLIGMLFFVVGRFSGVPFWDAFIFAIGIIVAMVPEGLLPTMTLALVLATQRMARRNVLIRHLPSIGTLGATNVICTDKTGTLTQNSMVVKEILLGQHHYSMGDVAAGTALAERYRPFFLIARLCHDLNEGGDAGASVLLGDPMEIALVEMAQTVSPAMAEPHRADEIPFDADRMRMSTVHTLSDGPLLCCKGAPETVTPLCNRLLIDGEPRPFTPELRGKILAAHEAMGEQGLRVLALAYRSLESPWKNIRKFLTYILAHNVPELVPYLAFSLFPIPLPLTPIQILTIDMGTDSLTALGLGVEAPSQQVMQRPPRSRSDRLFNWPLAMRAYLFLGLIESGAVMAAFFFVLHRGRWSYGEWLEQNDPLYRQATTAC